MFIMVRARASSKREHMSYCSRRFPVGIASTVVGFFVCLFVCFLLLLLFFFVFFFWGGGVGCFFLVNTFLTVAGDSRWE